MLRLLALSVLVMGCRTTGSETKHDADNPVIDNQAQLWTTQSDDEYFGITQALASTPFDYQQNPASELPADHPLRQRLQKWVDLLDGKRHGAGVV